MLRQLTRPTLAAILIFSPLCSAARADQLTFRFVPIDPCGTTQQVPAGPDGSLGDLRTGYGIRAQAYNRMMPPTQMVTFRHPYTGQNVTVPMTLPESTPRMDHRADRIVYDFGSDTVTARFLTDGSVEVIYYSGFLRPIYGE